MSDHPAMADQDKMGSQGWSGPPAVEYFSAASTHAAPPLSWGDSMRYISERCFANFLQVFLSPHLQQPPPPVNFAV